MKRNKLRNKRWKREEAAPKSRSFLRNKSGPKDKKLPENKREKREEKAFFEHQKEKNAIETSIIYSTFWWSGHGRVNATLDLLMPRLECENVISKMLLDRI